MSRTLTAGILFVSWFCIVSVTEAALGTSCNETADPSDCAENESCTNSICVCSEGYFNVSGKCESNSISVTLNANATSIVYGSSVVLTATITSAVSVDTVQWQKEEMNIDITQEKYTQSDVVSNEVTLTITNLVTNDGGSYRVQVNNSAGTISDWSTSVTLTVTGERPTVTVPGTISETDTSVTINCTASVSQGSPALTDIHWLFDNVSLSSTDNNKYSGGNLNTPSLTINKIASTDIGEYRCVATNLVGSTTSSQSVTLGPPSDVTIPQQPASPVNYNSSVTFTGSYTSNPLSVTIKWQKLVGGTYMDINISAEKYLGSSDTGSSPKLQINLVQLIDETSYRLMVSNGVGSSLSNIIPLNIIEGNLTVTTGASVTGRQGGSITIGCTVTGPEVNKIQWIKYIDNAPENIIINEGKYSGGSVSTEALTIHTLNANDAAYQYQCTASNPRGVFSSSNKAAVQLKYGQFYENCTELVPCDVSINLKCTNNRCLCIRTYYHKDKVCYSKTWLAPTVNLLNSNTSAFSVFWNNPTPHYDLVLAYEVNWRVSGFSTSSSGSLGRTENQYTISKGLMSGQMYIVNVISNVTLTNPTMSIVVASADSTVRLDPLSPGPILKNESNLSYNNLYIKWTAPNNTVITKYEVTIDGATYSTNSNSIALVQVRGNNFTPGQHYYVRIVTVSGETHVKKSAEHAEWIRIISTKPDPPTDVKCPDNPLDVSLHISWEAPTNANGIIQHYKIFIPSRNPSIILTSSNVTNQNVDGLLQEQTYTFTVSAVNDADESIRESGPSQPVSCKTRAGVTSAPTNLNIDGIKSRGFRIQFNRPDDVNGILAAYKIVFSEGGNCVQQILVHGICSICKSTVGCPSPINYTVPDITNNDISYTATGLNPYTQYMVKVVAINGVGEGHPVNTKVTTDEEVPYQPGWITASNIQSSSLRLAWTLPDPLPGNTTYTIYTYEGTDDIGINFFMKESTKVYGFDTKTLSVTGLEEYWPYKFKVTAATVKGNTTSDFSSVFRTTQAAPGQVLNLTIQQRGSDYKSAYVSWSPPALKDHNGVLKSYLFSSNHTGAMKEEQIPVLLSQATVEKKTPVIPESVYVIEVVLLNNESKTSLTTMQTYQAPAGPPPVTNIQPITTTQEEHKPTTNTIPLNINTTYFKNDENGKQVFFGVVLCAESKCADIGKITLSYVWISLPNWHKASKIGFPLYRVTNDTFMDVVRPKDSRHKRSTVSESTLKFIVGEDQTCPSLNEDVYCNGPLNPGTSYTVVIFACTNGGCTYYKTDEPFVTHKVIEDVTTDIAYITGSVVAVTLVLVVVMISILIRKRNRRHEENKEQANTYADLNLDERTKIDQPYSLLEHGNRTIKSKSVPLNSFYDYVVDLLRNSRQKLTKEYHDLLKDTERSASTVASSKNNMSKNRGNIIPYDFNRVKLCSPEASDYIDASVLLEKCYILTSYPIAKTIGNFWQMVWEQNVSTIVVMTGHSDDRESWYFSDNEGTVRTMERIDVELLAKFKSSESVTMRKIKLSRGKHSKVVNHFHVISLEMTDLPDQILALINTITQNNVKNTGPQVVHGGCTGIDNSGVYIAVDHAVKSVVSGGNEIDVYGTARTVMKERMFSVSSLEQYSAIYTCLQKYLQNSPACKNDATGAYEYLP